MRIGKLFGIDIIVHISWIFIFALVAWALGSDVGPLRHLDVDPITRGVLGVVTALLFFGSVLGHELAHSLLAKLRGISVRSITLFIFGGVSSLERDPTNPTAEGWISLVGPLSSLLIAGLFELAALAFGTQTPFGAVAYYLAYANVTLAVFNMFPALPLDGGRVLHAIIWGRIGDRIRATRLAVQVGRIIASLIVAFGVLETLVYGFGAGLWVIFIGWFILQAGNAELAQTEARGALAGMTALELAAPVGLTIAGGDLASKAFETLLRFGESSAPVVLDGHLLGIVTIHELAGVAEEERATTPVIAVMTRADKLETMAPADKAVDVLRVLGSSGQTLVPVVERNGALVGIITRQALLQRIEMMREHWAAHRAT